MTALASRMADIQPSNTAAMTARARALRAAGHDIIALSQGEPDFDTPTPIAEAGISAIRDRQTRYTATAGLPELRQAIAGRLKTDHGLDYAADAIIVGTGAKQVLFNALLATLDAGDEVIIPAPCWVSYREMVALAGGTPVVIDCAAAEGFKLTPAQLRDAITPATKWLLLNSPSNPTGAVYSRRELAALGKVLKQHDQVSVLCDDIYEKLVYPPARFASLAVVMPELQDRILVVNGVSKAHAMTGWRIGYGAGPRHLIKAMATIQGHTTSNASTISQHAAREAIAGDQAHVPDFAKALHERRDLICDRLNRVPGLSCRLPDGAFYVFVSCRALLGTRQANGQTIANDLDFALYLLERFGVATVPGSSFLAPGFVRVSYAAAPETLTRACNRIQAACEALVREVA